ncbi:MAG TPA: RidA family protein [Actinoplanes sp.]|nr:RidA family protein [Actinoplanes sp.]
MTVTSLNPEGLVEPQGYQQVAIATGSRMVFVSGQVSDDATGAVVGEGDLAAQTEQALRNVGVALAAAGATWADVVKTTIYVVDWQPEKMGALFEGLQRSGAGAPRATTMVGVATLADPRLLIEFDVIAVTA